MKTRLEEKFFKLVDQGHAAYEAAQVFLASGELELAQEEFRACSSAKAQAVLIVRNNVRLAALIGWIEEEN